MSKTDTVPITDFVNTADTHEESVEKTLICNLQTSNTKVEYVADAIEKWQEIAEGVSHALKSYRPFNFSTKSAMRSSAVEVGKRLFPDHNGILASQAQTAAIQAGSSFSSWHGSGRSEGENPKLEDGNYMKMRTDNITIEENNGRWGVELNLIPYEDTVWFGIDESSEYHRKHLSCVTDEDDPMDYCGSEIRLITNDEEEPVDLSLHLVIQDESIKVYDINDVPRMMGVDLGERAVYTTAVVGEEISGVNVRDGSEFRHHRNKLSDKQGEIQNKIDRVKIGEERSQYTDHMTHVFSREIIDIAQNCLPCGIILEDLTDYRKTAKSPIHDWPYAEMKKKIMYKATEAGIPVEVVDARNTSKTCRKCGYTNDENRPDGAINFDCKECGYHVHSDVNAAINIAQKF